MKISNSLVFLFALLFLGSCSSQKMLESKIQGDVLDLLNTAHTEHIIRTDDKIGLSVWNHEDLSIGSVYSIYNTNEAFGKWILVDQKGSIAVPKVGPVHLAGKTCEQAADTLKALFGKQITNPVVVVKVLNRSVNVFGEVKTPGSYIIEKENTTVAEMIGKAEGYGDYADLRKIQLIRNDTNYLLDLSQMDARALHRIPVRADDILVVPPKKGKILDQKAPTIIPFASAITAVALILSITQNQ